MKSRTYWVDAVKWIGCMMVVLEHFFESMVRSSLLPTSFFFGCFELISYSTAVQLFFFCSGYLHQKHTKADTLAGWSLNLKKKAIALGVPYLCFSTITWLLKNVFSDAINVQTEGLLHSLLVEPLAPYWYLYVLFFMYVITPTLTGKKMAGVGLVAALLMRLVNFVFLSDLYFVDKLLEYEIWFLLGACAGMTDFSWGKRKSGLWVALGSGIVFLAGVAAVEKADAFTEPVRFALGLAGCLAVVSLMQWFYAERVPGKWLLFLSKCIMPIYLMHTIAAAGFRTVLLKLGVTSAGVHVILGLLVSFCAPIVAAWIMEHIPYLDFPLNPLKYLRPGRRNNKTVK